MKINRKAKDIPQSQAYSDTNIHFGRIEQGEREVTLTTLVKVAEYLGCKLDDLV